MLERAIGFALGNQLLHRLLAHALEAAQRIAHSKAQTRIIALERHRLDGEVGLALVEVGRQAGHAHAPHIVDEDGQLFGQMDIEGHRPGIEFRRIMGLEPGGLIGEQRVGGGVRLVEAIAGKLVDQVEQLVRLGRLDVALGTALDEAQALGVHFRLDLLAHGAAQKVGVAKRVAGQDLRGLHHLFLIDEDAIGFFEDRLQQDVRIFNLFLAVLAAPEHRDIVHRAGTIERHQRDDVAEIGRAHRGQRLAHAFGFQLEHADRVAALEQFIDLGIVPGERVEIDRDAAPLEQLHRLLQHRQRLEAEKVELHQPRAFDELHVELGHRHVGSRIAIERHQLAQRPVADHHAGRVGGAVAREALQLHRIVDQALDLIVIVIFRLELGDAVQRSLQRPGIGRMVGHQLGQAVDLAIAHLHHAAGVLQHGARLQFTEGDDLGDMVAAIFLLHVADHLAAPRFAEVDIEVGHGDAFRVQEALEQQAQLQRIEIGDGQRPGDQRSGTRTTARPHRNIMILGPFDEVGHDQEVAGEAHLDDDVHFELQPFEIGLARLVRDDPGLFQPGLQPRDRLVAQHDALALDIAGQAGQDRLALGRHHRAALRHDQRVGQRLGQILEQPLHLRRRLHPGVGRTGATIGRLDIGAVGDAQHHVMRRVEFRLGKAGRVGSDQRQIAVIGQVEQLRLRLALDRVQPAANLDIEAIGEQRLQPVGIGERSVGLILGEQAGDRSLAAGGQRDHAVGAPLQHVERNMGHFLQRPVEMRHRDERTDIVIAARILRIEGDPVMHRRRIGRPARPHHAQHGADDRLHALALAAIGKGHRPIKAVAVGDRRRRKTQGLGLLGDLLGVDRPFEHGEGRKDAQRYEGGMRHRGNLTTAAPARQSRPAKSCGQDHHLSLAKGCAC